MSEECLICQAPLEYLATDEVMTCAICHKKENSKTRCINGHYVCNDCHTQGLDAAIGLCLASRSDNPIDILNQLMHQPFCHMHGPEHHVLVGAALLSAYKNAGGDIDLEASLTEMYRRGKTVPGGACGFWGACGAGLSTGMAISIITGATPLSQESFGLAHLMTAQALTAIGTIGGPRCCKRNAFLSLSAATDFLQTHFGITLAQSDIICHYSPQNNQCIGNRCPFAANRPTA